MGSDRQGRRARNRKHKRRARRMAHRVWRPARCGIEFREMMSFVDEPQDVVHHPITGKLIQIREPVFCVAEMPSMKLGEAPADVRTRTFRVQRVAEGRLFYLGANRRQRLLRPVLVEEAADDQ